MSEILTLLFDQTEKVIAWAGMVVLVFAITSMASCVENAGNNKQKTLTMLIDKGYHPIVVNCVMEGFKNDVGKTLLCADAFRKYPGQKESVQGDLGKFE